MTRSLRRLAAGLVTCATLAACAGEAPRSEAARPPAHPADPSGTHVVGYFAEWGVYARDFPVKRVHTSGNAARLTHLVYAFGSVEGGRCAVADRNAAHERVVAAADSVDGVADTADQPLRGTFQQLRKLKRLHPGLRVVWSFGGWSGSAGFTAAARDPAGFADSCRALVEDPRWADVFDGVDIDWEYPNACGKSCDTSGPDALARLTTALRSRFGDDLVTAAVSGDGTDGGKLDAADYAAAARPLDWLMPMTYDYFGTATTNGPTAPHSPLRAYDGIPRAGAAADVAIAALKAAGVPAAKLLLGIGFYGRGWRGVSRAAPGTNGTGPAPGTHESGYEDYKVLAVTCPPTGVIGGTAYAHCRDQWWSYDTPATIGAKMEYARGESLGGAFAWDLSGDTATGTLLTAIDTGLRPS